MRTTLLIVFTSFMAFLTSSSAKAGIYYFPANKSLWPENFAYPMPPGGYKPQQFRSLLNDLRTIAVDRGGLENQAGGRKSLRLLYLDRVAELTAKGAGLSVAERLATERLPNGLLKPEDALTTLRPAEAAEPQNFMVLANIATAHQMTNLFDRAVFYEEQALMHWPATHEGFTSEQLRWYRRVEKFHLLLMQQRQREEQIQPGKTANDVDALFPKFRFQNLLDPYKPGHISPDRWAELPGDAIPIVQQLLIWMPHDNRLYWLLGELLNAKGEPSEAKDILDDLVFGRRYTPTDLLRQHLRVLQESKPSQPEIAAEDKESPETQSSPSPISSSPPGGWLPDWRHVLVGFAAGVICTVLVLFQWREFTRRRKLRNSL